MDASALAWLASADGWKLLADAQSLPPDRLTRITRLRKQVSPELATAAVELIELRARAAAKFGRSAQMLLTPIGLEQSTGERIASYRASQFPSALPLVDACSGIGGDAMQFAAHRPVLAVDRDITCCICTIHNCKTQTDLRYAVRAVCADITELNLYRLYRAGFRAAFFDPGRRRIDAGGNSRRARGPEEYSPPLSWLKNLTEVFPYVCVKVSPLIDDPSLQKWRSKVEFISDRGECKEALLWIGDFAYQDGSSNNSEYRATVINASGVSSTLYPISCSMPPVGALATWIFEPDVAVVRAHLTHVLADKIQARLLDAGSYYLTSDADVKTPFATRYSLLDVAPMRPSEVQKRCVALGRTVTAVKTRWIQLSPDELLKRVPGAPKGAPPAIVIVTKVEGKHLALICEPGEADRPGVGTGCAQM